MSIRLAVHVGPHKTGSTSVQRALVTNRDRLAAAGVWYPPSLDGAEFPSQHADIATLLVRAGVGPALDWVLAACEAAAGAGCDTVMLSSENFRAPKIRRQVRKLVRAYQRRTGGETRLIYVRRDPVALARSRVMARLDGELGFFFHERYDLQAWAADFLHQQREEERFFSRQGARFLQLEHVPAPGLAAAILQLATDRNFDFITTGRENVTTSRLAGAPVAMLAYGLRVMQKIVGGNPIVGTTTARSVTLLTEPGISIADYEQLLVAFEQAVDAAVQAGFAAARRESVWRYRRRLIGRAIDEVRRLW